MVKFDKELHELKEKYKKRNDILCSSRDRELYLLNKQYDNINNKIKLTKLKYEKDDKLLKQVINKQRDFVGGDIHKNKLQFLKLILLKSLSLQIYVQSEKSIESYNEQLKELYQEKINICSKYSKLNNDLFYEKQQEIRKLNEKYSQKFIEEFEFLDYKKIILFCSTLKSIKGCEFSVARYKDSLNVIFKCKDLVLYHFIPLQFEFDSFVTVKLKDVEIIDIYKVKERVSECKSGNINHLIILNKLFRYCFDCCIRDKEINKATIYRYVNDLKKQ